MKNTLRIVLILGVFFYIYPAQAVTNLADLSRTIPDKYTSDIGRYSSIKSVGDINGDGYDDLVITLVTDVNYHDLPVENQTYVYYGREDTSDISLSTSISISNASSLSSIGEVSSCDLNADELSDIVFAGDDDMAAYILFGSTTMYTALDTSDMSTITVDSSIVTEPYSVDCGGDLNADGSDDVLIGMQHYYADPKFIGAAAILYGNPEIFEEKNFDDLSIFIGEDDTTKTGTAVKIVGDINADGFDDAIVSSIYNNNGAVYIMYGSADEFSTRPLADFIRLHGTDKDDYLGDTLSALGDVNADGYDDFAVISRGGYGRVYIVYGDSAKLTSGSIKGESFLQSKGKYMVQSAWLSSAGDINNDGFTDLLLSGTPRSGYHGVIYILKGRTKKYPVKYTDYAIRIKSKSKKLSSPNYIGDINGNGKDDFSFVSFNKSYKGKLYIVTN